MSLRPYKFVIQRFHLDPRPQSRRVHRCVQRRPEKEDRKYRAKMQRIRRNGAECSSRKFTNRSTFPPPSLGEEGGERVCWQGERRAERVRARRLGDEIHRHRCLPPSARYINNDIGVFTSAHASNRVQGRLLYRGGGLRYITHPRRESLNRVAQGSIPIGLYVDTLARDRNFFPPLRF